MDRKFLYLLFAQAFVCQVFTANLGLHPALKQYLLSNIGSSPAPLNSRQPLPAVTISKQTTPPNFQSIAALASLLSSNHAPSPPKPQPVSTASLLSALTETPSNSANSVDANLLNNLAMALQLLIVSNLLSSPQESTSEPLTLPSYSEPVQPVSVSYASHPHPQTLSATPLPQNVPQNPPQSHYYQYEHPSPQHYTPQPSMPNANFVGASSFTDPFMGSVPPISGASSSRGGFTLMSPYEALSPSSPFSDPILSSPYGSVMTSKKDFQSPYTSILAADNKDLFSISDFF